MLVLQIAVMLSFLLTVLLLVEAVSGGAPQTTNASATVDGNFLSVTSWHARTLTNVSWNIPDSIQDATHLIVFTWDEEATEEAWWLSFTDNISSRAVSRPSSTESDSSFLPDGDEGAFECTFQEDAFDSQSDDAFNTDDNREHISVDLTDGRTWWYTASLGQERLNVTTATSGVGQASVLLSEPGFYTACLLLISAGDDDSDERCPDQECVDITVYQPPYNFLEASFVVTRVVAPRFDRSCMISTLLHFRADTEHGGHTARQAGGELPKTRRTKPRQKRFLADVTAQQGHKNEEQRCGCLL